MEPLFLVVGIIATIFFFLIYGGFAWGFVLYKFWSWFILSSFVHLPPLSYVQAVAIILTASVIVRSQVNTPAEDEEKAKKNRTKNIAGALLAPWILLLIGWLFKLLLF